jgi:hypothetical protein
MLSNVNTEKGQILQTVLVGQPELWDLLRKPELSQFAQRISYDYFLSPLDTPELVGDYIRHRLHEAGRDEELFLPEAFEMIFEASGGVPRLINLVCDTALVYGYAEGAERIGGQLIAQVLRDKEASFSPVGRRRNETVARPFQAPEPRSPDATLRPPEHASNGQTTDAPRRPAGLSTIERAALRLRKDA